MHPVVILKYLCLRLTIDPMFLLVSLIVLLAFTGSLRVASFSLPDIKYGWVEKQGAAAAYSTYSIHHHVSKISTAVSPGLSARRRLEDCNPTLDHDDIVRID